MLIVLFWPIVHPRPSHVMPGVLNRTGYLAQHGGVGNGRFGGSSAAFAFDYKSQLTQT